MTPKQHNNLWKHVAVRNGWSMLTFDTQSDPVYDQHVQAGISDLQFLRSRTSARNDLMDLYALQAGITRHA